MNKHVAAALVVAMSAGCAAPQFGMDQATREASARDVCQASLPGWHWYRRGPADAAALIAQVEPALRAGGRLWFTSGRDRLAVCGGDACYDSIEFFDRVDGRWTWRRDGALDSICVTD
jgi:hypothetical protein